MAYSANLDQMLDALETLGAPEAAHFARILEGAGSAMAALIAKATGIEYGDARREPSAFGGTISAFWPTSAEQEIPECLAGSDDESEWQYDEPATTSAA